ncbi:MAG: sulfatase-like hydrolase/transferase [Planctomycetota bacterium]|jgi:uncharacterized sulfatase
MSIPAIPFRFECLLALALTFLAINIQAQDAKPARPNILWISCEDISCRLGSYGDPYAITPSLDKLAAEGVRYTRAFGHAGVCAINRSGIITGMYPTTIGTQHMRCNGIPPAYVKCFTEYLRAAGYWTTNRSKTDYNFAPPMTAWDRQGNNHSDWRSRPTTDTPFFSVINLTGTHESKIRQSKEAFIKATERLTPEQRHDPAEAILPPYYPDTPTVRRDMANLADIITAMDYQVSDILAKLKEDGLLENTIVWFWSDHGDGLPRAKRWLYDSGLRIPMIIRFPERFAHLAPSGPGTTNDELVAFVDYAPTMLSLTGVEPPSHLQGRAFLGAYKAAPRDYVFGARDRMDETYDLIRIVRDKRFKYIRNFEANRPYAQPLDYMDEMPTIQEWRRLSAAGKLEGSQKNWMKPTKPLEELYDTEADPYEINNLADDPKHAKTLARLRDRLERWQIETADLGMVPESDIWSERRPGGVYAVTEPPTAKLEPMAAGTRLTLTSKTRGASITYAYSNNPQARWRLYTGPILVKKTQAIRFKATRLGYKDSKTDSVNVKVGG